MENIQNYQQNLIKNDNYQTNLEIKYKKECENKKKI
jgi:hypothetical protein